MDCIEGKYSTEPSHTSPELGEDDQIFLNEKSTKLLIELTGNPTHGFKLAREIGTTSSHATTKLNEFEEQGLVTSEKQGRRKIYSLTEKGRAKAEALVDFLEAEG